MFNKEREAGVLLHITSLPSKYGIGTLGKEAYNFIDFLKDAKQKVWQILPLGPTSYGDSPYQSVSAFAVNYYLIDLDMLKDDGLLKEEDYKDVIFGYDPLRVDYSLLFNTRIDILKKAYRNFDKSNKEFKKFKQIPEYVDFGVFMALKEIHNYASWHNWDEQYRNYSKEVYANVLKKFRRKINFWIFTQFKFIEQWNKLRKYANKNGVQIMGDIPLYVGEDSLEFWKTPELFMIDENHNPSVVAGCPPDAFSEDGQLWGNPCYNWDYSKKTNYEWWNKRISKCFELVDILRIDHFRGFDEFYTIPRGMTNARIGEWVAGPKFDLFKDKLDLNIVAEDLGFLTPSVYELMRQVGFPGMKIIQFAFDGSKDNEHKPSNFNPNCIVYTGTHDNFPNVQYIEDLSEASLGTYLNDLRNECLPFGIEVKDGNAVEINETVIELAYASKANTVIIPLQDLLGQGRGFRMNAPSTVSTDNWSYRIKKDYLSIELKNRLANLVTKYNR